MMVVGLVAVMLVIAVVAFLLQLRKLKICWPSSLLNPGMELVDQKCADCGLQKRKFYWYILWLSAH